ncbi:hypothetical protein B0T14DRAFT_499824 [Immersiella caudata]|uniref:Uncharacterized protein n=1 Tax=Immersiella caudata TaxID=314043 RepID=A0AA40BUY7_9PEZI|nr:hypothetical protein B0T14DRAFT_499824 [Immersiella caudata]
MATPPATFSDRTNGAFTLPPQTTPFSPGATPAAGCSSRSVLCFTPAGKLRKNYACDLVDQINTETYKYFNLECYPQNFDLINNGERALTQTRPVSYSEQTVAYPGTACPAGFTPACTTALTLSNPNATPKPYTGTLTQTWCCPIPVGTNEGDWICTNRDTLEPTSRYCLSVVANTRDIWFGTPAGTTTNAGPKYSTSTVGADMSVRVLRKALPLGEYKADVLRGLAGNASGLTSGENTASSGGSRTATSTGSSGSWQTVGSPTSTASGTSVDESSGTGTPTPSSASISPGTIAGITVGALALVSFIAVGIYICLRYRREGKQEKAENPAPAAAEEEAQRHEQETGIRGGGFSPSSLGGTLNTDISSVAADSPMVHSSRMEWRPGMGPGVKYWEMGEGQAAVEMATGYNKSVVD